MVTCERLGMVTVITPAEVGAEPRELLTCMEWSEGPAWSEVAVDVAGPAAAVMALLIMAVTLRPRRWAR